MQDLKIIARYQDGRMVRGLTHNFWPNKPVFHVEADNGEARAESVEVHVAQLKAVFVVKSFAGNDSYKEKKTFGDSTRVQGQKLQVEFKDGEMMIGSTMTYDPTAQGFFLFPADPNSNNDRVFVVNSAVHEVRRVV